MNEFNDMPKNDEQEPAAPRRRFARILLPAAIVVAAVLVAGVMIKTKPSASRKPHAASARLVEVLEVAFSPETVVIEANGVVEASRQVALSPRVAGEVVSLSPACLPGGVLNEGETVLTVDPADYALTLKQRESDLAQARAAYELELGQQEVARQELDLLDEAHAPENTDLALRVPQLEQAAATLASSEAAVARARLDLERTHVSAPFNALVRTRDVVEGAQVNTNTTVATLVGTDEYWIEVVLPVDRLSWIELPTAESEGSAVRVYDESAWTDGAWREGRVLRLAPDLEEQGRMARLIVAVRDPLALRPENAGASALLIGSYVRAEIVGRELASAAEIDRALLHDGDDVWIMDDENRLEIRTVEVTHRGRDVVLITGGLAEGERVVVTELGTAVPGMALRTADEKPAASAEPESGVRP